MSVANYIQSLSADAANYCKSIGNIYLFANSLLIIRKSVGVERYLAVCRPHHYREIQVKIELK